MVGGAETLTLFHITIGQQLTHLLVDIRSRSVVEIARHNSGVRRQLYKRFYQVPFLLVGNDVSLNFPKVPRAESRSTVPCEMRSISFKSLESSLYELR